MTEPGETWTYASLTLVQPPWPGTKRGTWVAATSGEEQFRTATALEAMDRMGAEGWELVTFFPEAGDRPACFYFKARRRDGA